MYNLPYTNKQINIPYLLKIGNGKIYKIGKYLKDKNLPGVALFLGDGTEELVGAELRRGFGDNDINVVHSQVVSDISIESITQTAFQLPPATDVVVGIGGGKALDFAKYSFAMENGSDECKAHAKFVTKSNAEDGVAVAVEKYAL